MRTRARTRSGWAAAKRTERLPPSEEPTTAACSEPAASSTARTSSIRSSSVGSRSERDGIGEAGAALVEQDQAREGREPAQEVCVLGYLPALLDVRDPARNPDQV